MKRYLKLWRYSCAIFILNLSLLPTLFAQNLRNSSNKPVIDTGVFGNWPEISSPAITSDGRYAMYLFAKKSQFSADVENPKASKTKTLYIKNIGPHLGLNAVAKEFKVEGQISDQLFSNDSKRIFFIEGKDSLGILTLKKGVVHYTSGVKSFKIPEEGNYLAYSTEGNQLHIENDKLKERAVYHNVLDYSFSSNGQVLLINIQDSTKAPDKQTLLWVDIPSLRATEIWKGESVMQNTFDPESKRIAFLVSTENGPLNNYSLYAYQKGANKADCLVTDQSPGMEKGFSVVNGDIQFSRNGDKILFTLDKPAHAEQKPADGYTDVDVWNYKDEYTQADQLNNRVAVTQFKAAVNVATKKIVRLNKEGEDVIIPPNFEDYVLTIKTITEKIYYRDTSFLNNLVSTNDGARLFISDKRPGYGSPLLSPDDRFVVWFDYKSHQYFSLETASGKKRDISKAVPHPLDDTAAIVRDTFPCNFDICGWQPVTHSVFINDQYDIWKIDLLGNNAPVCITNGFGRRKGVAFGIHEYGYSNPRIFNNNANNEFRTIEPGEKLLLDGVNVATKYNGFWIAREDQTSHAPTELSMGPYVVGGRFPNDGGSGGGPTPIKSLNADRYLLTMQSATLFPNLYVTSNFKHYAPISDVHPEKAYNWLSAELVNWKMTDGDSSKGILYKPENFDPQKKYPVIFCYYAGESNGLYSYQLPDWSEDYVNIPYFVSNGYMVFMPDIHYKHGRNGQSVVNALVSAAHHLAQLPYVDTGKMAIQGHSFGGWETDYLVTHSHIFAAACSISGVADQISNYNEVTKRSALFSANYMELRGPGETYGLGNTPSTQPDLYEENSPVLAVENATTPLLLVSGDLDEGVPSRQGLEMYLAMNRADKKVWLLEYEKNTHSILGNDAKDYTTRLKQFFDYYLKGAAPPRWMVEGIPAKLKGIDKGYELEPGKTP